MKILSPHGEIAQQELAEVLEFALEGRRRLKEPRRRRSLGDDQDAPASARSRAPSRLHRPVKRRRYSAPGDDSRSCLR
ncbi:MAG: BREX system Lon protease-like protein BrxL [Myxococcota bacterium]|nr:BREX system Lon protease-like protein BrxL [Myxococcota bacterium]